ISKLFIAELYISDLAIQNKIFDKGKTCELPAEEKMDYDPLVDSGNKGKQFNIEFLVSLSMDFSDFQPTILVSNPKAKTYKDIKLQDKVSDYFDKKPVTGHIHII
ncbi:13170_t:CDS:2, partial [Racocetra persica]